MAFSKTDTWCKSKTKKNYKYLSDNNTHLLKLEYKLFEKL